MLLVVLRAAAAIATAVVGASKGQMHKSIKEINKEKLYFVDARRDEPKNTPTVSTPLRQSTRPAQGHWRYPCCCLLCYVLLQEQKRGRKATNNLQQKDEDGTDRRSVGDHRGTRAAACGTVQNGGEEGAYPQ